MNYTDTDLTFCRTKKIKFKQRVDGELWVGGNKFYGVSGSISYFPLPKGIYECRNLRRRPDNSAMWSGQDPTKGWSLDLIPTFGSIRALLRIHPDGKLPGTKGCIGIVGGHKETEKCFFALKTLIHSVPNKTLILNVVHDNHIANLT